MSEVEPPAASPAVAPAVHHIEVPRTARYYTVGPVTVGPVTVGPGPVAPGGTGGGAGPPAVREVWLAVHGYGQLAEYFARHFAPHAAGRLVIAPEALSRFYLPAPEGEPGGAHGAARVGATWMTREDRLNEIGDYVRYLDRVLDAATEANGVDPARALLGVRAFSQGAATACRWAAHRHAAGLAAVERVVLWGGTIPHDFDLAGADGDALRAARVTLVAGEADQFATAERVVAEADRLTAEGVSVEVVRYPGGHRLDGGVLGRVLGGQGRGPNDDKEEAG